MYPKPLVMRFSPLLILIGSAYWAGAIADSGATLEELPMLPLWCPTYNFVYKGGETLPKPDARTRAQQEKILKSGCDGAWHYCWALAHKYRATFGEGDAQTIKNELKQAISNGDYVLERSGNKCVLIPEIHAMKGEVHTLAGDVKAAEESFARALKLKPGYSRAYIGLSDLYEQQDQPEKSVAALEEGIKDNPRSSALKIKLKRLQGRLSGSDSDQGDKASGQSAQTP